MNWYESSIIRSRVGMAAVLAAGLGFTVAASAAPQMLSARQRPNQVSSFTLDFGVFGGPRQANITTTEFQLRVDAQTGTAEFVNYYQEVDPLLLPGDISTGNIIVEIVPDTSAGTYDPATGEFTTTEFYAVHFDGDLSAYGLTSPVYLPSTSAGRVTFAGARFGRIDMDWSGQGELPNPADLQSLIPFAYTCEVSASFGVRATPVDVGARLAHPGSDAASRSSGGCPAAIVTREEAIKE